MAGFPDLCTETLGISPSPLDLISGAIYRSIALAADDVRFLLYRLTTQTTIDCMVTREQLNCLASTKHLTQHPPHRAATFEVVLGCTVVLPLHRHCPHYRVPYTPLRIDHPKTTK